jgi:hypothetical protein
MTLPWEKINLENHRSFFRTAGLGFMNAWVRGNDEGNILMVPNNTRISGREMMLIIMLFIMRSEFK